MKDFTKLTDQVAFNMMREHLLKQNAKSIGDDENCRYRSEDGLKCAVPTKSVM